MSFRYVMWKIERMGFKGVAVKIAVEILKFIWAGIVVIFCLLGVLIVVAGTVKLLSPLFERKETIIICQGDASSCYQVHENLQSEK